MPSNYVIVVESGYLVLAREVEQPSGRNRYVPALRTVDNSLTTAELALRQLEDGAKYRALKEAVWEVVHGEECDTDECRDKGYCSECLLTLEKAYELLEGEE